VKRLLVALGVLLALAPGAAAAERPNIVVVTSDDQRAADMRVMPKVRRLVGGAGTTFPNSYVNYPLCCPSRATFLTGQYSHNHGVTWNNFPYGGYYAFRNQRETLPVWLQQAGYHTALIGKYLNEYGERDPREIPVGWDDWYGGVDPSTYHYFGFTLNENGRLRHYGKRPRDYQTDVIARKAVRLIGERAPRRQPFFLWVTPTAPHTVTDTARAEGTPAVPAPRHAKRFANARLPRPPSFDEADMSDKPQLLRYLPAFTPEQVDTLTEHYRGRLGSLLALDEAVADMVAALRRAGELDNTVFVYTSDNGWLLGEHRIRGQKYLGFEESIKVPLLVRGPGFPAGRRVLEQASNVDLAPTILKAAGARPGRTQDGVPLSRLVGRRPPKRDLLVESGTNNPGLPTYSQLHTRRWVLEDVSTGEVELYDLDRDPFQLQNLAYDPAFAAIRAKLEARLEKLRDCAGRGCR
jgi:N-acetylglucosamine-6-sulfatase